MAEVTNSRPRRDPDRVAGSPFSSAPPSRSSTPRPHVQQPPLGALKCCCGRTGCIYLTHNCTVLESVEKDVRTAAKLGQSLLERHEAYMADAERDRAELITRIGQLEMDKKELEAENAKKIEENRALLDQLETLNTTVSDSDTHIKMLEATLHSSQQIIRRLEGAAERAEDMERHLAALEAEQAVLQNTIVTTESEARSAIQRWKRAERGIADLQFQLEKMEKEAREEHERHLEIIDRMERQRTIEKELSTAAGRLKGAAAAKSLHDTTPHTGSGVVTHFVRDLLQDNANLQLGMAELRDMLMNSNDEIQMLRDQLMFHQPLCDSENHASAASTLRAELLETDLLPGSPEPEGAVMDFFSGCPSTPAAPASGASPVTPATPTTPATPATPQPGHHRVSLSQELHIHHHFHVGRKGDSKKPKKRRQGLTPTVFTPPAALTLPDTPVFGALYMDRQGSLSSPTPGSSPPCFPQHTSRDSVSTAVSGPSHRWSLFSDQPSDRSMSSVPSSPRTEPRNSIFDRSVLSDLSLPVSPSTSVDPMSPGWRPGSDLPSLDDPLLCGPPQPPMRQSISGQPQRHEPIPEDGEVAFSLPVSAAAGGDEEMADSSSGDDVPDCTSSATGTGDESAPSGATTPTPMLPSPFPSCSELPHEGGLAATAATATNVDDDDASPFQFSSRHHRPLHRAVSHESIISLQGGLDIHTLKARPSQLALRPLGAAVADTGLSSITARPVLARAGKDTFRSNSLLRDSLSLGFSPASRPGRIVSSPVTSATMATATASVSTSTPSGAAPLSGAQMLGKFVAWRPWGGNGAVAPAASATTTTQPPSEAAAPVTTPPVAPSPAAAPTASEPSSALPVLAANEPADVPPTTPAKADGVPAVTAVSIPRPDDPSRDAAAAKSTARPAPQRSAARAMHDLSALRSPGINQPGVIPGFFEYWAAHQRRGAPSKVHADVIDEEALREGLLGP